MAVGVCGDVCLWRLRRSWEGGDIHEHDIAERREQIFWRERSVHHPDPVPGCLGGRGAVGIGAILMGASVALATFQSRPQTDAAVVVSATSHSQNSAAPTAKQLPNAPIPQTGAPGPSSAPTVQVDGPV